MSEVNKPRKFSLMKRGHLFANGKVFGEIYTTELYLDAKDQFIPDEFIETKKIEVIELAPVLKIIKELVEALEHYESVREYKNLLKKEYGLDI